MTNPQQKPLPPGWKRVKLGEVCRVYAGGSAPQGKEFFADSGPLFFRVSDLGQHRRTMALSESRDKLSAKALASCHLVPAKQGTVLFPKSGAAIATNNRALLAVDGYIVGHLMALEPKSDVLSEWLYHLSCTWDMMDFADNTGYPSLKQSVTAAMEISLPPLDEQQRIVARLERQMALVEQARAAAEEMYQNISSLKAALLREIFSLGKNLPQRWTWVSLGEVVVVDRKSIPGDSSLAATLPYLSLEHIESNTGRILLTAANAVEGVGRSNAFAFDERHILYGKLRPYLNKVALPDFPGRCTTEALPLLPKGVIREYVALILRSDATVAYVMRKVTGSRMPRADVQDLLAMPIPLPPLAEQRRIVADLARKNAVAGRLETLAQQQLADLAAMPAALLREVFAGAV